MTEQDITQIKVGRCVLSIIGIRRLMEEIAETHAGTADDAVRALMLERLGKNNYIPNDAQEEYGKAFVREFRKFLGQPYTEEALQGIDIKVLGPGCNECDDLTQTIMEVLTEINLPAEVDHVRDIQEIARYGIMGSPALIINGKVVAIGSVPTREKIKKWLVAESASRTVA